MGILASSWTDEQSSAFLYRAISINTLENALAIVFTQYAVSEWIWFGGNEAKRPPHRAPAYLVSQIPFWYLWSTLWDTGTTFQTGVTPSLANQIALPIVATLGGVLLNLAFYKVWTVVFPQTQDGEKDVQATSAPDEIEETAKEDVEALIVPAATATAEQASKPSKPKILYINNTKIFLTCMVILFHVVLDFVGANPVYKVFGDVFSNSWVLTFILYFSNTNQSYFMALFFFFSGYFVPRSLDKKGTYVFLVERGKRIGLPFVLYSLVIGIGAQALSWALLVRPQGGSFTNPIYAPDITWFLQQLLLFNIIYVIVCGKGWSPKVPCPSMLGFLGVAIVGGLVGSVLSLLFPPGFALLEVPFATEQIFIYTVFFFGGAAAERNNWMEDLKATSRVAIYLGAILSWILLFPVKTVVTRFTVVPAWVETVWRAFFHGGICPVFFGLAVTIFFMDFVNKKYFFTDFFAKSMYTAYIFQRIPIAIGMKLWVIIMQTTGYITDENPGPFLEPGSYYIQQEYAVFLGCLFLSIFSMVVVWPMAYGIRSIPGFSNVL